MERTVAYKTQPPLAADAACQMCGSSYLRHRYNGSAHWFDCLICGYSSPGRTDITEALEDVRWVMPGV